MQTRHLGSPRLVVVMRCRMSSTPALAYFDIDVEIAVIVEQPGIDQFELGIDRRIPVLNEIDGRSVSVEHEALGGFTLDYENPRALLFCDNETNAPKLFGGKHVHGYFKNGFHEFVVRGSRGRR